MGLVVGDVGCEVTHVGCGGGRKGLRLDLGVWTSVYSWKCGLNFGADSFALASEVFLEHVR